MQPAVLRDDVAAAVVIDAVVSVAKHKTVKNAVAKAITMAKPSYWNAQ